MTALAPILQEYFTAHLVRQRAATRATIRTYADTWKLFLRYLSAVIDKPAYLIDLDDIEPDHVTAFLDYLEDQRHNSVSTRNLRLAGIKGVFAFWAVKAPERLDTIARIQATPVKRHPRPDIAYLTDVELQALLDAIPTLTWTGRRDRAMFAFAAQTGLRISELANLTTTSLTMSDKANYVFCIGKGRKERTTPLTRSMAAVMKTFTAERQTRTGIALFPNPGGNRLSPDAIAQRLALHIRAAETACPSLSEKHITVHTLRHTAAMRFLHAGIDTSVIALWLGHESTATTSVYLHADQLIKQRALERTRQPDIPSGSFQPDDQLLTWLESL